MTLSRWASILIALALSLASGAMYHSLAMETEPMVLAAARVDQVPLVFGPWRGMAEPADEASFAQTGARKYWMRTYVHEETKANVLVILMCGRAGKMAVHTPEVCYQGAGYELRSPPTTFALTDDASQQLWTARFDKRIGRAAQLRLYWGWSSQGTWEAATAPRWQFRGQPFLYKLYVSHEIPSASAPESDPVPEFLRAFVPVMQSTLFPS